MPLASITGSIASQGRTLLPSLVYSQLLSLHRSLVGAGFQYLWDM
jgi:hypothetical protein